MSRKRQLATATLYSIVSTNVSVIAVVSVGCGKSVVVMGQEVSLSGEEFLLP